MADNDMAKIGMAVIAAGSLGGVGGHTLSTGDDETVVNNTTVEACNVFIQHAERHAQEECEIEKLKILVK